MAAILVTGGAGFIGSHVVPLLADRGHQVTVLDSLVEQVHGPEAAAMGQRPPEIDERAEFVFADVRDRQRLEELVGRCEIIVHLASVVGLAQSMYEIERFVEVNCRGTAVLLEVAVRKGSRVSKIVVASSMSLYGEGRCVCARCGNFDPGLRGGAQLEAHDFEVRCPQCGCPGTSASTPEDARLTPTTVYAVTKRDQEELTLAVGAAYGISASALRLFNVYGPGQSVSNPYTGVAAIFMARLLGGKSPIVFEDGMQTRDFTHVRDVAEAFARAVDSDRVAGQVLNVGAGRPHTLLQLGELLARELGVEWSPEITRAFRKGDIRHCTAGTERLERVLGFRPGVELRHGVAELVRWGRRQAPSDRVDDAVQELTSRGLLG